MSKRPRGPRGPRGNGDGQAREPVDAAVSDPDDDGATSAPDGDATTESSKTESTATGSAAAESGKPESTAAESSKTESSETESTATESGKTEATATEASETETGVAGSGNGEGTSLGAAPPTTRSRRRGGGERPVAKQAVNRSIWSRLYHGETNFDFVGRKRLWFTISLIAVVISLGSLATRGLNLGIDFEGGVVWEVPAGDATVAQARDAVDQYGLSGATITKLESDEGATIRVAAEPVSATKTDQVTASLAELTGSQTDQVNLTEVGPSWGEEISRKALRALVVFLILVTIYIAIRFEMKMAIPTLAALVHDVIITVGVYTLTGLEVTPATVIAVLTILGYSIYDGIVVFDKVDENTRLVSSTGGITYGGMVNVSLNQTLMRSLNTTMTALLPVASLLIVGSWIMGARVLEDFALALLIGLFSGAYSSIFIASPLLAVLKEREPRYRDIRRRVDARGGDAEAVATAVATGRVSIPRPTTSGTKAGAAPGNLSGRAIPPRPRKKTKGARR
ncbi:MAG TPA: protein translocase subunit SecF [Acidimicrobiales bacterium]